ncbi:MAG: helix-turn-helix transcriptional regulator [Candidatus Aenigmarchaeota archaeon]|nr:helix-turn-helix transcriptional regulator [Candidatus Aenigmarchaeota archaeon]
MHANPSGFLKICILNSLKEKPMHGYELIKRMEAHGWKPSPGSLYPILASMKKKKLISLRVVGNKKIYTITRSGTAAIKNIELHKERILQDMKKTSKVISDFLGEDMNRESRRMKALDRQELAIPMMRIGRKLMLCMNKKSNLKIIKKILSDAEKQIDELLK